MTLAPIRPDIIESSVVREGVFTIREAIEWFKKVYLVGVELGVLAEPESDYMNKQFGILVQRTVPEENLPSGPLGQFISSVAIRETMLDIADEVLSEA